MKINILPWRVLDGIASEEELLDSPLIESIYEMRKLRAAIFYQGADLEVGVPNRHGQVFLKAFDIWINEGDYVVVDPHWMQPLC